ncbi:hypothetical protein GP486_006918, partial [Trichoglossum hirsutum]
MPLGKGPNGDPSSSTENTKKPSEKLTAYDAAFEQHLIEFGIHLPGYGPTERPTNWKAIKKRMVIRRPSLSESHFPKRAFKDYVDIIGEASNESDVATSVFPTLRGETKLPSATKKRFTALDPLTNGKLVIPEPDYCVMARLRELDQRVRNELRSLIVPSRHLKAPMLSNYFTELKRPRNQPEYHMTQ